MNVVSVPALNRGAAIMEFAFLDKGTEADLDTVDLVGIVAAYIARGYYTAEIEERLQTSLGTKVAADARRVFETFDDWDGRGLWTQGPAMDDIAFTDRKLQKMYPHVCMEMKRPADVDALCDREFTQSTAASPARNNTQTTDCLAV